MALVDNYENALTMKIKEIEELSTLLKGSRKEIETLNIKEQYVTRYKYNNSSNELSSQN